MGSRYRTLAILVTAGTTIAAPNQILWQLEDNILTTLSILVPPGHNGTTGIRFLRSQQPVIPFAAGRYLIANGETVNIEYNEELTESQLLVQTYNTDIYDHTFYLRAVITDLPSIGPRGSTVPAIVPTALLTSAGVLSP